MHILERYVETMNAGDVDKIVELFAEDCVFVDGGGRKLGFPEMKAEGKEALRKLLNAVFSKAKARLEMLSIEGNQMKYDVFLGKLSLPCIGTIEEEGGLIKRYSVEPRG